MDLQWDVPAMLINVKQPDLAELFLVEGMHRIACELRVPEGAVTITRWAIDSLCEEVECCGKCCDHGSPCLLEKGHDPLLGHDTQHGCCFYGQKGDE